LKHKLVKDAHYYPSAKDFCGTEASDDVSQSEFEALFAFVEKVNRIISKR
jgi:hypothetical protein